jgi:hypothetical protein
MRADGAIRTHQMAAWIDDLPVHNIDRRHFHNPSLQIAGFGVDDT